MLLSGFSTCCVDSKGGRVFRKAGHRDPFQNDGKLISKTREIDLELLANWPPPALKPGMWLLL